MKMLRQASRRPMRSVVQRLLPAVLAAMVGCRGDDVATDYGSTRQGAGRASLNGVDVFTDLLRQNDCETTYRWRLSPRTGRFADVIVWVPDALESPSPRVVEWFEEWLAEDAGRMLVYVGRDYDAAPAYWAMCSTAISKDAGRYNERRRAAEQRWDALRASANVDAADPEDGDWFAWNTGDRRQPAILWGPWSEAIDPQRADLTLGSTPAPPRAARILLDSDVGPIAFETPLSGWSEPQILVVANGGFLLNYPLVNRERRKLAEQVVQHIGPGRRVAILMSETGGRLSWKRTPR